MLLRLSAEIGFEELWPLGGVGLLKLLAHRPARQFVVINRAHKLLERQAVVTVPGSFWIANGDSTRTVVGKNQDGGLAVLFRETERLTASLVELQELAAPPTW